MENKKDIGKAFREKLAHLDKSPNDKVWSAIHADLQKKKKRRFLFIPFWFKTIGLISLGILFSLFVFKGPLKETLFSKPTMENENKTKNHKGTDDKSLKNKPHRNITNPEVTDEHSVSGNQTKKSDSAINNADALTNSETSVTNRETIAKHPKSKGNAISEKDESKSRFKNPKKYASKQPSVRGKRVAEIHSHNDVTGNSEAALKETSASVPKLQEAEQMNTKDQNQNQDQNTAAETNPVAEGNNSSLSTEKTATQEKPLITVTDSLKGKTKTALKDPSKEEKDSTKIIEMNRISLFVYASPAYIGLLSKKSPFDTRLNYNTTKSEISWSYGAYASYEATPKWSLRFGVVKTATKLITENAPVDISPAYSDINYTHFSNAAVYNMSNAATMDIIQEISYTEVPLELKYAILNKTFGLNAYGGFSLKFLDKNAVFAKTPNGQTYRLGETKNLSSNSYSVNLGLGIDYKFSRRLRLNMEPIFKFNFADYKSFGKMKPYTIGVLTGLQFSFK